MRELGDEFVGRGAQADPVIGRFLTPGILGKERAFFEDGLMQPAHRLPMIAQFLQGNRQADAKGGGDQVEHASALRSAMR